MRLTRDARWIAVVGPDAASATEIECAAAEEVGAGVAVGGAILVCGGLGGVMEAACRGARSRLGFTVGFLPGLDREDANGWVSLAVPTGLGETRNALIVRSAAAVIAVGGGWGTLSEIALARRAGKPVIGLGTWELTQPATPGGSPGHASPAETVVAVAGEGIVVVADPAAAVAAAFARV